MPEPNQDPEQLARDKIDAQLISCGWTKNHPKLYSCSLFMN
jgi:hypothetical protein